ncbi:hypothetical protein Efla_001907 [Eimeria flavescens]
MALSESTTGEAAPDSAREKQPLMQRQQKASTHTYKQFCCCSLGTAVTVWAVFLLAVSTYILFDRNVTGAAYTAGGVVGLVTAGLLLSAIGRRNAFPAFVAVYTQIALNIIWFLQLALNCYLFWRVLHAENGLKNTYTVAKAGWVQRSAPRSSLKAHMFILDLPLNIVLCARIGLLAVLLLLSHFTLRLLWSFYRVLQAGGTSFEYKTAEDLEEAALQAQLPTILTAAPTPRHGWDPAGHGSQRSAEGSMQCLQL